MIPQPDLSNQYQQCTFICLNPHCKTPRHRVFRNQGSHESSRLCSDWIMQFNPPNESYSIPIVEDGNHVRFSEKLCETAYTYRRMKNLYINQLNQQIAQLQSEVMRHLNGIKEVLTVKLDHIFQPLCDFTNDLDQLHDRFYQMNDDILSQKISELVRAHNLEQLSLREDLILFSKTKIDNQLFNIRRQIEGLIDQIICPQQKSLVVSNQVEVGDLKKYLEIDGRDAFAKLQKLSQLLRENPNSMHGRAKKKLGDNCFKINCVLCNYSDLYQGKKFTDSGKIQALIDHSISQHLETLIFHYSYFISKNEIHEIDVPEIFFIMEREYEGIDIIYFEGRKFYDFKTINRKRLQVQVIRMNENSLGYRKFLRVQNDKELFMTLVLILHHCEVVLKKNAHIYASTSEMKKMEDFCQKNDLKNVKFIGQQSSKNKSHEEEEDANKSLITLSDC